MCKKVHFWTHQMMALFLWQTHKNSDRVAALGRSGDALGRSGDALGTLWGRSGTPWGHSGDGLGTLWGRSGTLWRCSGMLWGRSLRFRFQNYPSKEPLKLIFKFTSTPQSVPRASPKRPQSVRVYPERPQSVPRASPERPQSIPRASPERPQWTILNLKHK